MYNSKSREEKLDQVIEGCRMLIASLSNPHKQPLEREAGYLLAQLLHLQAEELGLLENKQVCELFDRLENRAQSVRRYPEDFTEELKWH
jgi:hypothetical protein